jgi:hypothetical protein
MAGGYGFHSKIIQHCRQITNKASDSDALFAILSWKPASESLIIHHSSFIIESPPAARPFYLEKGINFAENSVTLRHKKAE